MTTCYTNRLRPLAQRMANGVAETKGYNGAAINPWRMAKRQVKSLFKVKGKLTWTDESGCSASAKGLPAISTEVDNNGELNTERSAADKAANAEAAAYLMGLAPKTEATRRSEYHYIQQGTHYVEELDRYLPAWVEYKTATNVEGEALPQGLRTKARRVDEATGKPEADTTLQWVGQMELTVTPQLKPMAGKGRYWYEVDRIEGFIPATTEERDEACLEQLRCFVSRHRKVVYDVATCLAKGKYEAKAKSLDNALRLAFDARPKTASDTALSLDARAIEEEESSWVPVTGDLMAELVEQAEKREWMDMLNKVLAGLTAKQREAVEMKAAGLRLTTTERRHLQMARAKATVK